LVMKEEVLVHRCFL